MTAKFQDPETQARWEEQRRDCLAARLVREKTGDEIKQWLAALVNDDYRDDMRRRLREKWREHQRAQAYAGAVTEDC